MIMDRQKHLNEMYDSLVEQGRVSSKKDFADKTNIHYTTMISALNGDERYLTDSLFSKVTAFYNSTQQDEIGTCRVPLLPTEARGGTLADWSEGVEAFECETILSPIKDATFAIQVTGDSMSPRYPSGSTILIKKIDPSIFINYGNAFVLDTANGAVVKIIMPSEDEAKVRCVSLNPAYPAFEIAKVNVLGWYRVLMTMSLD